MEKHPYPQRVLPHLLAEQAGAVGEKPFLYFQEQVFSFREVYQRAAQAANGYCALGVRKGEPVAALMPNRPEFLFHWFGLSLLGAVDTPINPAYKGEFLRHAVANVGAQVMLVHEELLEQVAAVRGGAPKLKTLVVFNPSGKKPPQVPGLRVLLWSEFEGAETEFRPPEPVLPADPLTIIYTSGTTGPSKGVVLSHHALYCYGSDAVEQRELTPTDLFYTCLPLYHINARFMTIMPALLNGTAFAVAKRYSARNFWGDIRRYRATVFGFLGGIAAMMLSQPEHPDDADNPARAAFGGPLSPEMAQQFERRFGVKVYTGFYGMTEAIGVTYLNIAEMEALKRAGKWEAVLGMGKINRDKFEVRLVDEGFREVPPGQPGEIVCRPTRPFSMMTEYVNMPEKTVEASRNLWFNTGDLARRDPEGYFYFVDRKKDYMRRRGENISSFEVETVCNAHPAVAETAAVGAASELGEDEVMVVVRLLPGRELAPEGLVGWCEARMPRFMVPRYVRFVAEDFPRTPTNRIQKFQLRQEGITPDTWDREAAGYELKK